MSESTKEAAERIRAQLKKEKGWNARDVSIKVEYYSLGSSIHATIRNARVPEHELKPIIESGERIHRCEITGEILGGGNRYVHIHHSDEVQEILARRHIDALQAALGKLDDLGENELTAIAGTDPQVHLGRDGSGFRFWTERAELSFNRVRPGEPYYESWLSRVAFSLATLCERRKAEAEAKAKTDPPPPPDPCRAAVERAVNAAIERGEPIVEEIPAPHVVRDPKAWTIQPSINKRGAFFLVHGPRVERWHYDRLLEQARELGGWYSRAWHGTPGGFGFGKRDAAEEFLAIMQPKEVAQ